MKKFIITVFLVVAFFVLLAIIGGAGSHYKNRELYHQYLWATSSLNTEPLSKTKQLLDRIAHDTTDGDLSYLARKASEAAASFDSEGYKSVQDLHSKAGAEFVIRHVWSRAKDPFKLIQDIEAISDISEVNKAKKAVYGRYK